MKIVLKITEGAMLFFLAIQMLVTIWTAFDIHHRIAFAIFSQIPPLVALLVAKTIKGSIEKESQ